MLCAALGARDGSTCRLVQTTVQVKGVDDEDLVHLMRRLARLGHEIIDVTVVA